MYYTLQLGGTATNPYKKWNRVLGDGGAISLDYSFTKTETHKAGFDISFGIDWFNAHMGYSVSKSNLSIDAMLIRTSVRSHACIVL